MLDFRGKLLKFATNNVSHLYRDEMNLKAHLNLYTDALFHAKNLELNFQIKLFLSSVI